MTRFMLYKNENHAAEQIPYLLDVQSNFLDNLDTRVVIPLRVSNSYASNKLPKDLMPEFSIGGQLFVLETPKMAAVPTKILKKKVGNLNSEQSKVITAIDRLFHGF